MAGSKPGIRTEPAFLFLVDLAKYTPQVNRRGPAATALFTKELFSRLEALGTEHGFSLVSTAGDAALFHGSPPSGGAHASPVEFFRAIDGGKGVEFETKFTIRLRCVVHVGTCAVERDVKGRVVMVSGADVITPFRLEKHASPGELLVTTEAWNYCVDVVDEVGLPCREKAVPLPKGFEPGNAAMAAFLRGAAEIDLKDARAVNAWKIWLVRLFTPRAAGVSHPTLGKPPPVYPPSQKKLPATAMPTTSDSGFHVFLSHNSKDKKVVVELWEKLQAAGLTVWLDIDQIPPGQNFVPRLEDGIRRSRAIVACFGPAGVGPWHDEEMQAGLRLAVSEEKPVIPVILPGAVGEPDLPMFLKSRRWVDLRSGFSDRGLAELRWGITGIRDSDPKPAVKPRKGAKSKGETSGKAVRARGLPPVNVYPETTRRLTEQLAANPEGAAFVAGFSSELFSVADGKVRFTPGAGRENFGISDVVRGMYVGLRERAGSPNLARQIEKILPSLLIFGVSPTWVAEAREASYQRNVSFPGDPSFTRTEAEFSIALLKWILSAIWDQPCHWEEIFRVVMADRQGRGAQLPADFLCVPGPGDVKPTVLHTQAADYLKHHLVQYHLSRTLVWPEQRAEVEVEFQALLDAMDENLSDKRPVYYTTAGEFVLLCREMGNVKSRRAFVVASPGGGVASAMIPDSGQIATRLHDLRSEIKRHVGALS